MSSKVQKLIGEGETFADKRRLLPAIQAWEEARRITQNPGERSWLTYNLGVLNWVMLGNGVVARQEFLSCIAEFENYNYGNNKHFKVAHANAIENAMLCALSYEEFEALAAKLILLTPGVPILAKLLPETREAREKGDTWLMQFLSIAYGYYNRNDPSTDPGRYGEAKSTYHLILTHRRELRVPRDLWRVAVIEICALSARISSDCMMKRGGDNDSHSPEEILPILTETIPFADEYLNQNSGDDGVEKMRNNLVQMVKFQRQRWVSIEKCANSPQRNSLSPPDLKTYRNKRYCFKIDIPLDWKARGLFSGSAPNPEFDGPNGASLKFAIGPIAPETTAEAQQETLARIMTKYGHIVKDIGYISIQGKTHATVTARIPRQITLKNYSIIFNGLEYLVTANLDTYLEEDYDRIVETFRFS